MSATSLESYFEVACSSYAALESIETILGEYQVGRTFSLADLVAALPSGVFRDQVRAVIRALIAVSALRAAEGDGLTVMPAAASEAPTRTAIRQSLRWAAEREELEKATLLASAPAIGTEQLGGMPFQRHFADLRIAVRDLIATSRSSLVLASPYWDGDVVNDLLPLIERRLAAGVAIEILARAPGAGSPSESALRVLGRAKVDGRGCALRLLDERSTLDRFGAATFHFKVAIADSQRVYLGSANFNTAGMASRWELGVLLAGHSATRVSELVSALLRRAREVSLS